MSADLSEEVEPTALANLQCIDWVRQRITLPGFVVSMWKEDHQVVVSDFLATNPHNELKKLIAFMTPTGELCIQYALPQDKAAAAAAGELMYFLRDPTREVRARSDATPSSTHSRSPLTFPPVLPPNADQHGNHRQGSAVWNCVRRRYGKPAATDDIRVRASIQQQRDVA